MTTERASDRGAVAAPVLLPASASRRPGVLRLRRPAGAEYSRGRIVSVPAPAGNR